MSDQLTPNVFRALDADGVPVPGALAYFYETGTTSPVTVSDFDGTELSNPLAADGSGNFVPVFYEGATAVKVVITDADGATLPGYPIDPVPRTNPVASKAAEVTFTPTTTNTAKNVQTAIGNNTDRLDVLGEPTAVGVALITAETQEAARQAIDVDSPVAGWFASKAEAEAGAVNDVVMSPLRVKQAVDEFVGVSEYVLAYGETIAAGTQKTIAHGLSERPVRIEMFLVCVTADVGFTAAQRVMLNGWQDDGGNEYGAMAFADATNIYINVGNSGVRLLNASGGQVTLTLANWTLNVRAFF